jgi:hypothetical protein
LALVGEANFQKSQKVKVKEMSQVRTTRVIKKTLFIPTFE